MPKTSKSSQKSTKAHQRCFIDDQLQPQINHTGKTHPIRKTREKNGSKNEESTKQLTDIFISLVTLVNQQFSQNAHLFNQNLRKSQLTPILPQNDQIKRLSGFVLPTIVQSSKMAEQQEETIKKQKEQTQITSNSEKF